MRLTVVGSQGEADLVCALLRTAGIPCAERAADVTNERGGGFGGWREILVLDTELEAARELLATARDE